MKFLRLLCLLPALVLLLATCKEAGSPTDANGNPIGNVTTTLAGIVVDEAGQPVSGVAVIANSKNAVTDKYGTFMIQNASVPGNRCFIICKKNGYFTGSRAEVPKSGGITELRLTLQSSAPGYTVNSSTGGTVSIGTASVKFPPSAFVTSDGSPFTGTVKVAAKHLDPSNASFYNSFSGDMTARRTDGTQTELLSYGVLRVRLTDETGAELKLAAGKTATLTYPITASQQKTAPTSMPLWYFDEALGMWKEEGVAVKSGDSYTGDVSHFTDWNCDLPVKTGIVKGRVVCNNEGISKIYVTVGEKRVLTDTGGYFSCRVPIDIDFVVSVNPSDNYDITATDISIPALSNEEERSIVVQLTSCPALIVGKLTDCNDRPIAGIVVVFYKHGIIFQCTVSGDFKIYVPTGTILSAASVTLNGDLTLPFIVGRLNPGDRKDIGKVVSCKNGESNSFYDIDLGKTRINGMRLSPDGSRIVISTTLIEEKRIFVEVYDTKTGVKVCGVSHPISCCFLNFSADGTKLLYYAGDTLYLVNPYNGSVYRTFKYIGNAHLMPDGSAFIMDYLYNQTRFTIYSTTDGSKIKEFSFKDSVKHSGPWEFQGMNSSGQFVFFCVVTPGKTRIVNWDIASNKLYSDFTILNTRYIDDGYTFWNGFSPDNSTVGLGEYVNGKKINFYNTRSGEKLNTVAFDYIGNIKDGRLAFAVSNNSNFVSQGYDESDLSVSVSPEIRSYLNLKIQNLLGVPLNPQPMRCYAFNYSSSGQFLAGIIENYDPDYLDGQKGVIRIWKVK